MANKKPTLVLTPKKVIMTPKQKAIMKFTKPSVNPRGYLA